DDVQMPVSIELSKVARAKPSVLGEYFRGSLRVFIITLKDHRAANQKLADALRVGRVDFYFRIKKRLADRTDAIIVFIGSSGGPRCFGQAVTLNDRKSKLVKVFGNRFIKTRAGRYGKPQISTEGFLNFAEKGVAQIYFQNVSEEPVGGQH